MAIELSPSNNGTAASPRPDWFETLLADYRAGVAKTFILYGNVSDFVDDVDDTSRDLTLREYLTQKLARVFTIASYSPDEGITFPGGTGLARSSRERFEVACSLGGPAPSPEEIALGVERPSVDLNLSPPVAFEVLARFLTTVDGGKPVRDDAGKVIRYEGGDESGLRGCVVVDRLDLLAAPADKGTLPDARGSVLSLLHRLGTSRDIDRLGNLLVLIAPSLEEVHPDLRAASSGIRAIEIPLPSHAERVSYAKAIVARRRLTSDLSANDIASATAGLTRRSIEDIALRAVVNGGKLTRDLVLARKAELLELEYSGLLSVTEPTHGFEAVGGHEHAISYLKDWVVPTFADPSLADERPSGIIFSGPSGTGKTWTAEALAAELALPFVVFDIGRLRDGIVGSTEKNTRKAFRGIRALSPCVVFIDELDQTVRRGEGGPDSGGGGAVENGLFQALLTFIGDPANRGNVLFLAASNWPNRIDAALTRPGRFDLKIPLLVPQTDADRIETLRTITLRLRPNDDIDWRRQDLLTEVAARCADWTPAELERLVKLAMSVERIKRVGFVDALFAAHRRLRPATRQVREMTAAALAACDDLELIPPTLRKSIPAPDAVPSGPEREPQQRTINDLDI